jgi:hypothetical protein
MAHLRAAWLLLFFRRKVDHDAAEQYKYDYARNQVNEVDARPCSGKGPEHLQMECWRLRESCQPISYGRKPMLALLRLVYGESRSDANRNCKGKDLRAEQRPLDCFNGGIAAAQLRAPPKNARMRKLYGTDRSGACVAERLCKQDQILACPARVGVRPQL